MTDQTQTAQAAHSSASMLPQFDPGDASAALDWLRNRYMLNPRDELFEDALREILEEDIHGNLTAKPQRIGLVKETRGILVTGNTGDGKTALIRRNLQRLPGIGLTDGMGPGKALYLRVPPEATLKGMATEIMENTGYPKVNDRLRTMELWAMALNRLSMLGITILWIDEAHHMMEVTKEIVFVLRRLKSLMQGDNGIALVVSGINELDAKFHMDRETSERFNRIKLGPIRTNKERMALLDFIDLSCSYVQLTPISDEHIVERLEFATHGSIGRSIEYCFSAIGRALRRKDRALRLDDFRRSFNLKRGFDDIGPFDDEAWPDLKDILEKKGWSV